jgi:putative glycosyl hydrolase
LKIVGPALNYCAGNCNETDPIVWLKDFFASCTSCKMDYLGMHWYACTKDALTQHLALYEQFGKPLWVTEFSCLDMTGVNSQIEQQYMAQAVAALEADPMVFRYAWFTGRDAAQPAVNLLGVASGTLTALGQQYVTMP